MYAQVEKLKESKCRSIANSINDKKNLQHGIAFIDQRKESITQMNTIGLLEGTILPSKCKIKGKSISYGITSLPPLQRELDPYGLNVAGENHDKSNGRREEEKAFCKEKVGGGYWLENEFKIRPQHKNEADEDYEQIPRADPTRHLYKTHIWMLGVDIERFSNSRTIKQLLGYVDKLIYLLGEIYDDAFTLLEEYYSDEGRKYITRRTEKEWLMVLRKTKRNKKKIEEKYKIWRRINSKIEKADAWQEVVKEVREFQKIEIEIKQLQTLHKATGETMYTLGERRSKYMLRTAEKRTYEKGVWKVGDAHIGHIKDMIRKRFENTNYVDMETFNEEYEEWHNTQDTYES